MSRIDDAVEQILRVKFVVGMFEKPFSDQSLLSTVGCKEHWELAYEAVRKSLVLLKNGKDPTKPFLPLDKNAKRIIVAGSQSDNIGYQCGGWTITWYGGNGRIMIGTSNLEAIKETVGETTEVICEDRPSAATVANQDFTFAVVTVREVAYAEFSGDMSELNIPFNGSDLINLVASKIPTLVIMMSGRPLVLEPEVMEKTEAVIAAWLPGSEGGGADAIFRDYGFEGLLPVTWFISTNQLPLNAGHKSYHPLFWVWIEDGSGQQIKLCGLSSKV